MEEESKIIRIPKSSINDEKTFDNFKKAAKDEGMTFVIYDDTLAPTISTPGTISDVTLDDTEVENLIKSIENEGLQKIIQNKKIKMKLQHNVHEMKKVNYYLDLQKKIMKN